MRNHISYLKYVLRHKWFVLQGCLRTRTPIWLGLIHDWSKLLPSEWTPYVNTFYNEDGSKKEYKETPEFVIAWNDHQKRNKHHWQYWILTYDRGSTELLEMPDKYVREMVADWVGASIAITGTMNVAEWYEKNKDNMKLHPNTRIKVEALIRLL